MSKVEFEQRWARKSLREMLSAVEERVGKLEESMEDAKESDNAIGESIENLREKNLKKRNNALEAMVKVLKEETMATTMALSTRIEKLEGELPLCRAAVGKGVSSVALIYKDAPKPKELVGTRFACGVDNFLRRMESYFRAKNIMDDAVKVNTVSMFLTDIALLLWRGRTTDKRQSEIGTWQEFQCKLKGQFYPEFTNKEAQAKLQRITQRSKMGEYV
ncbi:hypothetical protein Golob_007029 [Gossypium lobatum]|uniref:Retrotransposon gag domain-containing protein n=2 Tax=Gossypium lobatum TaxID=34289 RepID=A0A7J8NDL0_9ROSI|nr:hypothetical protein [Gossypium lobatum]